MKNNIIAVAVAMLLTLGCAPKDPVPYAVIAGKTNFPITETMKLVTGRKLIKEIKVDEQGNFRDTLRDLGNKHYYVLFINQKVVPLYLENGTNLNITIEEEVKDTKVEGVGAENMQFLLQKSAYLRKNLSSRDTILFSKNPQDFKKQATIVLDSLRHKIDNSLTDKKFAAYEKKWLDYYFIQLLDDYPRYYGLYTRTMPEIPADYNEGRKNLNCDISDDYDNVSTYQTLVQGHLLEIMPKYNDKAEIERFIEKAKNFKSAGIQKDIGEKLASFFKIDSENNDLIYNYIQTYVTDTEFKEEIKKIYEGAKKLTAGTPSPSFNYENFKGGTTSLESLKGKVVYIDVWATWCMPCIQELPHLKELERKYHGKPVEFVSISIDEEKDRERWKEFIIQRELVGTQLIADKAWKSEFIEAYVIKAIPRFILIDKEGKIVRAEAPRPSDPATADFIDSLL